MVTSPVERAAVRRTAPRRGRWRFAVLLPLEWSCAGAHAGNEAGVERASRGAAPSAAAAGGYELPVRAAGTASFPEQPLAAVPATTQLARLSHAQYRRTVQDLLGFAEAPEIGLAPDALVGLGFDTGSTLRVDARLGPQYRAQAESLARLAVTDAVSWATIVPCSAHAPGCREQFLQSFSERAFRRPLSAEDLSALTVRFDAAASLYESGDTFRDGVRWTVESLLQAPEFLYRVETSSPSGSLDDYELAVRLSYFLFDSLPDEPSFAAARAGALRTDAQIEQLTRRMLGEPRVLQKLVAFHEQAWQFGRFAGISPDLTSYPRVPRAFVWRVRRATALFVRDVLQHGGGLEELLTAQYAYADAGLAPLYGASVPAAAPDGGPMLERGARFERVPLDPAQRSGLLMQVGHLAANAYAKATDPIHRGLFVIRNLLCREVPDPPPGATTTPPPPATRPIVTTRDEVALVTGQSFCPTCHVEINAPGFAFEGFDAVGQLRREDNGVAVDTSGEMVLDGETVQFDGPVQLMNAIARSHEAHRCYTRRWMELAYGRPLAASDESTLAAIAAESRPLADLIVAIVLSRQFRSRGLAPVTSPATAGLGAGAVGGGR
ncbi:MAG: hypothetical protein RL033_7095 [Pseudomonadota bacterium]